MELAPGDEGALERRTSAPRFLRRLDNAYIAAVKSLLGRPVVAASFGQPSMTSPGRLDDRPFPEDKVALPSYVDARTTEAHHGIETIGIEVGGTLQADHRRPRLPLVHTQMLKHLPGRATLPYRHIHCEVVDGYGAVTEPVIVAETDDSLPADRDQDLSSNN